MSTCAGEKYKKHMTMALMTFQATAQGLHSRTLYLLSIPPPHTEEAYPASRLQNVS